MPFAIGDCTYPTVVIESFGRTETRTLPLIRTYYSRDLGFVLGTDAYSIVDGEPVPLMRRFYNAITDDPAVAVPR